MAFDGVSDQELRRHFEMLKGVEHHKNELILVNTTCSDPKGTDLKNHDSLHTGAPYSG